MPPLRVLHVPVACCALESLAAASALAELGIDVGETDPAIADVMVVSGTVTHAMAATVQGLHARLPDDARVVAFGACASTGGPYWDSPTVVQGIESLFPVDRFVPGCPPRPQALVDALTDLLDDAAGAR
jgi:NADH-quinone oxidoreductase subunit B